MAQIRTEHPADVDAIGEVVAAAFGRPDEARLVERLRGSEQFIPALSVVAIEARVIVGHVMVTYAVLRAPDADRQVLSLAPLSVVPARQRSGIGIALTEEAISRADAMREPLVIVLGHPTYYPRFGFEPADVLGVSASFEHTPGALMVRRLAAYSPEYRGTVVYPPAFDEG